MRVCGAIGLYVMWGVMLPVLAVAGLATRPGLPSAGASATSSAPASMPVSLLSEPVVEQIELTVPGQDSPKHYWLRRPAGYGPGQCPALLIVLHGTDDTARQMIDFWAARSARVPVMIAAPQAVGPGWRDSDAAIVHATLAHLKANVSFDAERVLLAGFSAGGAMTFQLLYVEKLPVTAAAALANYVPPWITEETARDRREVPVFYAVGMEDINHERMREGIQRLRAAGARVDLDRPRIGHVLNADVAQSALDWFFDRCAEKVEARLRQVAANGAIGELPVAERVVEQWRWHEAVHVQQARQIVEQIEAPGRRRLQTARDLIAGGKAIDAAEVLDEIENTYGPCRLGQEARSLRLQVEADPAVRKELADRRARTRANQALAIYAGAQRLVAQQKFAEAADECRRVVNLYSDTPSAERARYLLKLLEKRANP